MPALEISPARRYMVLATMCLSLVLVVAGVSMLSNALPDIAQGLGLSQTSQTWVVDAYALALASLLLVAGAIGDRYGRRGALAAGTVLFGIGAIFSAYADSGSALIAFRAITGIGAALIMPGTLSTITSVFPPEKRAMAVGVWAGFAMAGGSLGLVGSGFLLNSFWWGSVFLVTAIVAAASLVAIIVVVPSTKAEEHVGLDPLGTVLSAIGVGGVVFGIIEGPERGWTSAITLSGLVVGVAALVAFVLWELRAKEPLLDPRLFRLRGFATGSASMLILFLAMFGFFLVAIQFLQLLLGYSPLKAGVAILPMTLVMLPLGTIAATLAERYGHRRVATLGLVISAIGLGFFATVTTSSSYAYVLIGLIIAGVGVALAMTPATTAIVASLPAAKQGVASAVNDAAREIGAALGVAVLASAFNSAYRSDIETQLDGLPADVAAESKEAPALALQAASELGDRGTALADAAREAFISGMRAAMLIAASLMVVAALFTWFRGPKGAEAPAEDVLDDFAVDADFGDTGLVGASGA
jgi:EmrB/QacA subfamily drug resistance transporter